MSVSSISSSITSFFQTNSSDKDTRTALRSLASTLQKSDLSGAQNAFSALALLLNGDSSSTTANGSTSDTAGTTGSNADSAEGDGADLKTLLQTIGDSLQSGDFGSAQQALRRLQQMLQAQATGATKSDQAKADTDPAPQSTSVPAVGQTTGVNLNITV
jgi:hypothetical protein